MIALRDSLATFLGGSAACTGVGTARLSQDRTVAITPRAAEDETERCGRTDRDREIELRILMSNWM